MIFFIATALSFAGTAFANESVMHQDRNTQPNWEFIEPSEFSPHNTSIIGFYNEVLAIQRRILKSEYETTQQYNERYLSYVKDELEKISVRHKRYFVYYDGIISNHLNSEFTRNDYISYDADSELLNINISIGRIFLGGKNSFLQLGYFKYDNSYITTFCDLKEKVKMSPQEARKFKEGRDFAVLIKFKIAGDSILYREFTREDKGRNGSSTGRMMNAKLETGVGYYRNYNRFYGASRAELVLDDVHPHWERARIYLFDRTTQQIVYAKDCEIKNLGDA